MWKYYAALSALFAAFTAILSKCGVKGLDPNLATAIRVTFVLILVWGIAIVQGSLAQIDSLTRKNLLFLALSAAATGLSWLFYFKALAEGDASKVAPLDKLSVPMVMVFSIVFLGEDWSWKVVLGGALITAGSLLLMI